MAYGGDETMPAQEYYHLLLNLITLIECLFASVSQFSLPELKIRTQNNFLNILVNCIGVGFLQYAFYCLTEVFDELNGSKSWSIFLTKSAVAAASGGTKSNILYA